QVLDRIDEAEALLRKVLDAHPQHGDALAGLGRIARRRGDRAGSLAMLEAAAAASPGRPNLKAQLAAELRDLGRRDEAEAHLRSVLETHPKDFDALTGLAQLARDRGDRAVSLSLLQSAATAHAQHAGLHTQMASDLRELGRMDEAEVLLRTVLD